MQFAAAYHHPPETFPPDISRKFTAFQKLDGFFGNLNR
jgi:hypothetical protein